MTADAAMERVRQPTDVAPLARRGGSALIVALSVNALVTTGAHYAGIGEGLMALTYPAVLTFTALGVVGATITYAVIERLTSAPDRAFLLLAAVVLVVSVIPDFVYVPGQPGGSLEAGVALATMHVTTAAIVVWFLVDRTAVGQSSRE